jgi:hypothetical protein
VTLVTVVVVLLLVVVPVIRISNHLYLEKLGLPVASAMLLPLTFPTHSQNSASLTVDSKPARLLAWTLDHWMCRSCSSSLEMNPRSLFHSGSSEREGYEPLDRKPFLFQVEASACASGWKSAAAGDMDDANHRRNRT